MKIPASPPDFRSEFFELIKQVAAGGEDAERFASLMANAKPTDEKGRYLPWSEFRFRKPPQGLDSKSYWALTRNARFMQRRMTPFVSKLDQPFVFVQTDTVSRRLHEIDSEARGGVQFAGIAPKDQEAERFLIKSLLEEPFNSSLLEGAATTRDQAKKLIRENKRPMTISERMVLNNYRAIEFIKQQKNELLTIEIIHHLHRILTQGTLDDDRKAGAFRSETDNINVVDEVEDEILHIPPPARDLPKRVQLICDFANGESQDHGFIHPVLRAIILHFMLAYDHPYVDGNGRTARALFYWSVVKDGYWLLEYVSISRIINEAPVRYGNAFLYTETDDNDLTYFIHHQLDVLIRAIRDLGQFIKRKQDEISALSAALNSKKLKDSLNHRQLALLHDAIRSHAAVYKIAEHEKLHGVSYLTARSDLEGLAALGYLRKQKRGNTSHYSPVPNLARKLGLKDSAEA
ncbi:MAG: Fic family protein [Alphaproteobacteria bacterium]|nr:Fic family protein [Alphaproteobacteria bacterium]